MNQDIENTKNLELNLPKTNGQTKKLKFGLDQSTDIYFCMTFACLMLGISIIVLLTFISVRPAHNLQKGKYLHFSYSVIVHIITTHSYRDKSSLNGRIPCICKHFWSYGIMIIIELKYIDNSYNSYNFWYNRFSRNSI